jgi:hypothetical protein
MIENSSFDEIGCEEAEDREIPREDMMAAFAADDSYHEYIREYQAEMSESFEDLVNMS